MKSRLLLSLLLVILFCTSIHAVQFQEVKGTNLNFFCENRDAKYAQFLLKRVDERISNFQEDVGFYPDKALTIVIAPDKKFYDQIAQELGPIGEQSQALFTSGHNVVYIRSPRDGTAFQGIEDTILHEYIHYFVSMSYRDAPLWFHEGMAVYFSGQYNWEMGYTLAKTYMMGSEMPLAEMTRYPENRLEWSAFYAKSAMAVRYLSMQHKDQFSRFWHYSEKTHSFQTAFYQAFYQTFNGFCAEADDAIKREMIGYMILVISGLIWGLLPIVLIFGYFRKRPHKTSEDDEFEKEAIEKGEDYWNSDDEEDKN
ncbi:MAG TPA: hypothetical protein PLE74_00810 [Candidatus Cloacimonadota bacterium]|nr:hypothetical protein [Candidatus Cloacimonadota bacterium]HPT70802.1 hypothetical protein [Candidatus Cloacimonadota bacterium]